MRSIAESILFAAATLLFLAHVGWLERVADWWRERRERREKRERIRELIQLYYRDRCAKRIADRGGDR